MSTASASWPCPGHRTWVFVWMLTIFQYRILSVQTHLLQSFLKNVRSFWARCRLCLRAIKILGLGLCPYSRTAGPVSRHTCCTHSICHFVWAHGCWTPASHVCRSLWPHCDVGSMTKVYNLESSPSAGTVPGRRRWQRSARMSNRASVA